MGLTQKTTNYLTQCAKRYLDTVGIQKTSEGEPNKPFVYMLVSGSRMQEQVATNNPCLEDKEDLL